MSAFRHGVALLAFCWALTAASHAADYGRKVSFRKGEVIPFPGLTVKYLGERRVKSPVFKPGFLYHDFEVAAGREVRTVSWSSGTGCIGPQDFKIAGKSYFLELKASVAYKGWMKDNELVIWPEADFLAAAKRR